MTDLTLFREYEPHECGADGYPIVWHRFTGEQAITALLDATFDSATLPSPFGVKDVVRANAEDRCVRCGHPYRPGCGEWEDRGALAGLVADLVDQDELPSTEVFDLPGERRVTRAKLWSPCDEHCTHPTEDERGQPIARWEFPHVPGEIHQGWVTGSLTIPPGEHVAKHPEVKLQASWRILTVHHLNGRKHDLRWWNLAALCQRCHLVIQGKVQMERVYPFEHTVWFQPYAAGWYSYAYEGRNITRQEAIDDMDRLLALERIV